MAECGDILEPEQGEFLNKILKQEIAIILVGKLGAGKTTLLKSMVGEDADTMTSPDPTTDDTYLKSVVKHGKKLVIYDTPGLIGDEKAKKESLESWSEKLRDKHIDLLVCCIPVGGGCAKFKEDGYPIIMQCLHKIFGSKIWERCAIAYTFSNQALDHFQCKCGREQAIARYIEYIQQYSKLFQDELENLNVKNIQIKSIFEWERENNNQYPGPVVILGIPAGDLPNDRVLPGIKEDQIFDWTDAMMLYWFMKCDSDCSTSLIEFKYEVMTKNESIKVLGGSIIIGASVGALTGAIAAGGPIGAIFGTLIGVAVATIAAKNIS